MSFSDRRQALGLLALGPLAACGFVPVHGADGTADGLRGRVRVAPPDDRLGFELVARLEDRLGRASAPTHVITYALDTEETPLGITGTDDITRIRVIGVLSFAVTEAGTEAPVQDGVLRTFTAFSTTGSPVATIAARRDAEDRLATILADRLVARLLADADRWP